MDLLLKNIEYLMTIHGHSQKELAKRLDISKASVSRWLKGHIGISKRNVKMIAEIYNVKVVDLQERNLENSYYTTDDVILNSELNDVKEMYRALSDENKALRKQIELLEKRFLDEG